MKAYHFPRNHQETYAGLLPLPESGLQKEETDLVPSPDEVARRAYFNYQNAGSLPGHEVQHWLQAEADLIAERSRTRIPGFHNHN